MNQDRLASRTPSGFFVAFRSAKVATLSRWRKLLIGLVAPSHHELAAAIFGVPLVYVGKLHAGEGRGGGLSPARFCPSPYPWADKKFASRRKSLLRFPSPPKTSRARRFQC